MVRHRVSYSFSIRAIIVHLFNRPFFLFFFSFSPQSIFLKEYSCIFASIKHILYISTLYTEFHRYAETQRMKLTLCKLQECEAIEPKEILVKRCHF